LNQAYRSYLADLEQEGRQTLSLLAGSMLFFALFHPILLLLALPTTCISWLLLYRSSRQHFKALMFRLELLQRSLRFDDYDPDLAESIEPGVHEGTLRLKHSNLENYWRSFEASCRYLGTNPLPGYSHIVLMVLPLLVLTIGLLFAGPLRERWNWLLISTEIPGDYWLAVLQVLGWLIGITAATLGKYVIQVALVNAAWNAVVKLPEDGLEMRDDSESSSLRDEIITWKLPEELVKRIELDS
jgi:hypothetical protein